MGLPALRFRVSLPLIEMPAEGGALKQVARAFVWLSFLAVFLDSVTLVSSSRSADPIDKALRGLELRGIGPALMVDSRALLGTRIAQLESDLEAAGAP